jgi:hypothetical protein
MTTRKPKNRVIERERQLENRSSFRPVDKIVYDFNIRVLIYPEDNEFVAHALEMDLLGYGSTEADAIKELSDLVRCQISFAHQKNDDSLLIFPAPKEYFKRWEAAHRAHIRQQVLGEKSGVLNTNAVFITFTKQEIRDLIRNRRFQQVAEANCA